MIGKRGFAITLLAVTIAALAGAQGFEGIFEEETVEEPSLSVGIHGDAGVEFQYFFDNEWESEVEARPAAEILFTASAPSVEAVVDLDIETSEADMGNLSRNLIDEIYVTSFFGAGRLTAGLTRIEWGKGDGVHAIDPLNPTDQSAGPTADYLDSRSPEIMAVLSLYLRSSATLEIVYKPFFHPTMAALTGRWAIVDVSSIPGYATIEPIDVRTLEYSQGAARLTGSLGPLDLGILYYYGYMPEPGYEYTSTFTGTDPYDPTHYTVSTQIVYTRAQLIGAEFATVFGPFTAKGEAGFWLSEDTDGTAPELYNTRLSYLGGVDLTIPGTTMFASVQLLGSYTFDASDLSEEDVDNMRMYENAVTSHMIIGAVEIPLARDTIHIRVAGMYAIEARGYLVMPEFGWTIADGIEITARGSIIEGESLSSLNSPYYAWRENDNVSISLSYAF